MEQQADDSAEAGGFDDELDADDPDSRADELERYERDRRASQELRSRISWQITGWAMAAALALLGYDGATAALDAHSDGRSWIYPALIAVVCGLALVTLAGYVLRKRRRR